ncbi:MAG TPA: sulfide/dihydroorotate dehydrogenase-like FAD/NAD-binding protein [Bacillota bacterium]|nr:sulfide/dihydroorotate dehydrogenase-like FAD/NAD-binding protein [Bacillota bacterium]HPF42837.1 sulfide/dihydroorotate dehydrogenase-like FAD/NAD-binding protein [Bacillota bacterium]HPJ86367.1 sulfide/dihydroorotate dehydrogenase-like FAD/NAD-binding protein [Bacillota bacterium]HPQ62376.1 sulfide/dihydroorotate dehydrogenase-like FAD/NAD-binding protein [Bacillota bacterium]HRX92026.1 sulfide/dihydroorotate dehydrogenase-like FAD/NAD-binding protein [Candidatus Izemoplasmatales bacterium
MYEIIEKKPQNADVDLLEILAPMVAKNAKPGQFLIIRVDKNGERIPMTIVSHTETTVTIIVQKVGYSTMLLGKMQKGDALEDVVGPLGMPTIIRPVKKVLGIAGGVGAAPLYPQLREYASRGSSVDLIIGARNRDHLILKDDFAAFCENIHIATDDGSIGTKGFVTDVAKRLYETETYDLVIAIGPLAMMRAVVELDKKHGLKTDVSLNPIMIDGTGMCGNCRVSIAGKTYFACVDGPDFPGDDIDFDELLARQNSYREEEHICRIKLGDKK